MYLQPGGGGSGQPGANNSIGAYSRHMRSPVEDKNAAGFMRKRYGYREGARHDQIALLRRANNQMEPGGGGGGGGGTMGGRSSPPPPPLPLGARGGLLAMVQTGAAAAGGAQLHEALTRGNAVTHRRARIQYADHSLLPGAHRGPGGRQVHQPLAAMEGSMLKLDSQAMARPLAQQQRADLRRKSSGQPRKGLAVTQKRPAPVPNVLARAPEEQVRAATFSPERPGLSSRAGTGGAGGGLLGRLPSRGGGAGEGGPEEGGADMRAEVDKIRGYLELLDQHSLHHFIVWKGRTLDQTPEYASFQRTNRHRWGPVRHVLALLERLLADHAVPLAVVDGKAVVELAAYDVEKVHREDLFGCVANLEQIRPELAQRSRFQAQLRAQKLAAVVIQSAARMFVQRRRFGRLKVEKYATVVLQAHVRCWVARLRVARLHRERVAREERLWEDLHAGLRRDWGRTPAAAAAGGGERVAVHVPSLTIEEHLRPGLQPGYRLMQNLQLAGRAAALGDPRIRLVYVAPFPLYPDALEYLRSVLAAGGVPPQDLYARLTVVVPENADRFPPSLPLAAALYYSPVALHRIRQLCRGRPAFVVPARAGAVERRLALALGLPLLGPDPRDAQSLGQLSVAKRLFAAAGAAVPVGAHDIYDAEDFAVALTKLVASNLHVRRWLFKIDADYSGMGVAHFDTHFLECIGDLRQERAQLVELHGGDARAWAHPDAQLVARAKVLKALKGALRHRAAVCFPQVYPSWEVYLRQFVRFGGVIEAEPAYVVGNPAANIFIAPGGETTLVSTQDILAPPPALAGAARAIAAQLHSRGVIGYATVQFQAYWEPAARDVRLWATGLDLHLTALACAHGLFALLNPRGMGAAAGGALEMGCYQLQLAAPEDDDEEDDPAAPPPGTAHYGAFDYVFNPCLAALQHGAFFKLCRLQGVSFDLQSRLGVVFQLPDSFAGGVLSFIQFSSSREDAMTGAAKTLKFLRENIGVPVSEQEPKPVGTMTEIIRTLFAYIEKAKTIAQLTAGGAAAVHPRNGQGGGGGSMVSADGGLSLLQRRFVDEQQQGTQRSEEEKFSSFQPNRHFQLSHMSGLSDGMRGDEGHFSDGNS